MSPPTSPQMKDLEELELGDEGNSEIGDALEELPISPVPVPAPAPGPGTESAGFSTNTSPSKQSLSTPTSPDPSLGSSPTKTTPSKVKAAAAMWGKAESPTKSASASPPTRPPMRVSPSSSFRSIPASSSVATVRKGSGSPEKPSALGSSNLASSPVRGLGLGPQAVPETRITVSDEFAEVPLSLDQDTGGTSLEPVPVNEAKSYSLSPGPPPAAVMTSLPEPVITPPAKEEPRRTGFFSLGFGASPAAGSSTTPTPIASAQASRSTSTTSQAPISSNTGWRSTMSNLFVSRSASGASPNMDTLSPGEMTNPNSAASTLPSPSRQNSATSASASFMLNRMSSTPASRDRRISKELGGGERLREGFERVRNEMEGAAREMRRERQATASTTASGSTSGSGSASDSAGDGKARIVSQVDIDWSFWGAVVQDYEEVAVSRPKDLSKAIQNGIPPVIRGAIWQLMSSSKDISLEESYKALLKITSQHEKAIQKDLSRTFPHHKFFQEGGGVGQEGLFMVVKAYSLYDQEVGYTQGLAFIVAALLLNMPDEEAFCVLVRLMDSYNLRSHFLPDMPGLQLRLFQLDRLLEETIPLLHTHFVRKGIKSSMWASQWFMTLFSYRFPLSLVYRVLDIVFAEGLEAMFRFSLAILQRSEDKLLAMDFEQILNYLQSDLFEIYRVEADEKGEGRDQDSLSEESWKANEFVRDAYEIRITPFMLDSYEAEYDEMCKTQNKHAHELDQLRNANRALSSQVHQLEASLAAMNQEHVDLVRQLVMSKIEKEETANELVRVKLQYAELAHAQQDAMSTHSRSSASLQSAKYK